MAPNRRTATWLRALHAKAVAGDTAAQDDLGLQQPGDDGCLPRNARAAFRWLRHRAAAKRDRRRAQAELRRSLKAPVAT